MLQMENLKVRTKIPWSSTTKFMSQVERGSVSSLGATHTDIVLDLSGPEDVPILQYTSGSTSKSPSSAFSIAKKLCSSDFVSRCCLPVGTPKGVIITHSNLMHNLQILQDCTGCNRNMVAICFLTHFHMMGLICHYLFVPFCGGTGYFMSPVAFTSNPGLYLRAVSKHKGTFSMVPNFALDLLCGATCSIPAKCNLSSLRFLSNGSESVSAETMLRFQSKFSSFGLRRNALRAFYGLSEHTVHLCASAEEDLFVLDGNVSNGIPHHSVTVKAVEPETHTEVPEGAEGEIWVHSESKALGYWGNDRATEETFFAELKDDNERTYLRTGDVGFLFAGHVFIRGRLKYLMIFNGRKIYLNDIENSMESLYSELRPGRTAALEWISSTTTDPSQSPSTSAERRGVAFFAELQNKGGLNAYDCRVLAESIATSIGVNFKVETQLLALLPLNGMPCTGSGKKLRLPCRIKFLKGTLPVIFQWSPTTNTTKEAEIKFKPELIPSPPKPAQKSKPKYWEMVPPHLRVHIPSTYHLLSPKIDDEVAGPSNAAFVRPKESPKEAEESYEEASTLETMFCLNVSPPTPDKLFDSPFKAKELEERDLLSTTVKSCTQQNLGQKLSDLEKTVLNILSKTLGAKVEMDTDVWAHGCDFVKATQISAQIEQQLGFTIKAHLLYGHQTPRDILERLKNILLQLCSSEDTSYLSAEQRHSPVSASPKNRDSHIAVISMACRFPGCDSPESLWQLLTDKQVTISHFQDSDTGQWIHGGFTQAMAIFDYNWFGYSKMEASKMDPQQSLLLHTAWDCLHRAGYSSPEDVKGLDIGVFIGFGSASPAKSSDGENLPPFTGYAGAMAANRISYTFDLKGPSMAIDTACASSLTALNVAFNYMLFRKCSQALVGGVNALLDTTMFQTLANMNMLSSEGECCVFDVGSSGYVRGEGCGMVLLKQVGDAVKDDNRMLAVVKSVEVVHTGRSATLTSPNKNSQKKLIETSLTNAKIAHNEVSYLEAHGTGTPLRDATEIDAINETFLSKPSCKKLPRVGPLIVGSVKANIGHLEAGAGVAGLIKSILVLEHAKAPGNPLLKKNSPALKIDRSQVLIPDEMVDLDEHYLYRSGESNHLCAVVNSFGLGGALSCAVLQQYSQLPHLAQVSCGLILGGGVGQVSAEQLMSVIQLLRARLQPFNDAYNSCIEALQEASKILTAPRMDDHRHPACLLFCLLYSTTHTLLAHGIKISFLVGTSLCAELVSLVLNNVLLLSDAVRLLLIPISSKQFKIQCFFGEAKSTIPFSSPTLNQWISGPLPQAQMTKFVEELQKTSLQKSIKSSYNSESITSLLSVASRYKPLVGITVDPDSVLLLFKDTLSLLQLCTPSLINHFREFCLQLRQAQDQLVSEKTKKPQDTAMPKFYERYPMRRLVQSEGPPETEVQDVSKKEASGTDGFLQTELVRTSTPTLLATEFEDTPEVSPIQASSQASDNSAPTTPAKQAIVDNILDFVSRELVQTIQPNKEASNVGLDLDSISAIELQDYLLNTYHVDIAVAQLLKLGTVEAIAAEVLSKQVISTKINMAAQNKETQQQEDNVENTQYPVLTKEEYYSVPSMDVLRELTTEELKCIPNFTVGRFGHGKVEFLGQTNVTGLNLNQIIDIQSPNITVHRNGKSSLNKPALLFIENVQGDEEGAKNFTSRLLSSMAVPAVLVHSDPSQGLLVIKVNSFY